MCMSFTTIILSLRLILTFSALVKFFRPTTSELIRPPELTLKLVQTWLPDMLFFKYQPWETEATLSRANRKEILTQLMPSWQQVITLWSSNNLINGETSLAMIVVYSLSKAWFRESVWWVKNNNLVALSLEEPLIIAALPMTHYLYTFMVISLIPEVVVSCT